MENTRWRYKLVSLAIALALIVSLAGLVVIPQSPVLAQTGYCNAYLVANITAPAYTGGNATISAGTQFNLDFTITNTGNCTATFVLGNIYVTSGAHVVEEAEGIPALPAGESYNFTAVLQCDEVGFTVIHVNPQGHDECFDEEIADDLSLFLGLGHADQRGEEPLRGIDRDQLHPERFGEECFDLLALVHPHHAVIDEDAGQLVADGPVDQGRRDR